MKELIKEIPKVDDGKITNIPSGKEGMSSNSVDHFGFQYFDKFLKALKDYKITALISLMLIGFVAVFWSGNLEYWCDLVRYFSIFVIISIFFGIQLFCCTKRSFWFYAFWVLLILILLSSMFFYWKDIVQFFVSLDSSCSVVPSKS